MKKKTIVFVISYIFIIQPMNLDSLENITFTEFISSKPPEFGFQVRVIVFASFFCLQPIGQLVTNSKQPKKIKKIPIQKVEKKEIKKKPFLCKGVFCMRSFANIYSLKRHMEKDHLELIELIDSYYTKLRPYKCTECTWAFNNVSHLKSHKQIVHQKLKKYVCRHCYKKYKRSGDRNKHQKKCKGA